MPSVRLVRDHDYVAPTRERIGGLLELLDRREEQPVLPLLLQKLLQVRPARGLLGGLPQEKS